MDGNFYKVGDRLLPRNERGQRKPQDFSTYANIYVPQRLPVAPLGGGAPAQKRWRLGGDVSNSTLSSERSEERRSFWDTPSESMRAARSTGRTTPAAPSAPLEREPSSEHSESAVVPDEPVASTSRGIGRRTAARSSSPINSGSRPSAAPPRQVERSPSENAGAGVTQEPRPSTSGTGRHPSGSETTRPLPSPASQTPSRPTPTHPAKDRQDPARPTPAGPTATRPSPVPSSSKRRSGSGGGGRSAPSSRAEGSRSRQPRDGTSKGTPRSKKYRTPPWLKDVHRLQSSVRLLIPRLPFARLVRRILLQLAPSPTEYYCMQGLALQALQEAAEDFLVAYLSGGNLSAIHGKRKTLMQKDLRFLVELLRAFGACLTQSL